jgi:hypothetical protein
MKDYSQYKLNVKRSPIDKRDWKAAAIYPRITLPKIVDYRPQMQPVRDQGQQGSCLAMAGEGMKEYQERMDVGLNEYMSPQFLYNLREDPSTDGMFGRDLMEILKEKGICTEAMFRYGTMGLPPMEALMNASLYKIANYALVNTIDELKTALYLNGPCVICVPVYNYGPRMWKQMPGDIFLGGHGMCLAGYNDDLKIFNDRNSWGPDWGDRGYTEFPFEDFGLQWELWSSIDVKSNPPIPPVPPEPVKKGCLSKIFGY